MSHKSRRSIGIGAAIAAAGIVVSGAGIGYAANGGSFILGHGNNETATSTLRNTAGTPLSLVAPVTRAPLAVNSNVRVAHLNADMVDGLHAAAFQRKGSVVREG